MLAVISDIHSNTEALTAVLEDIAKRNVTRIVCLGDVIGYGPEPESCMDVVMEKAEITLMGNHDYAVLYEPSNFNIGAESACFWTRRRLENEEDAAKVFGIQAPDTDVTSGQVDAHKYRLVCERLHERFPGMQTIAITLRGSISASHNTWSGILWDQGNIYIAPLYDITHIVDRVGGGDSFMGGLIYGLLTYGEDRQRALNFAVAASCLKHTVFGDFNMVSVQEVEKLAGGDASGRVSR